MVQRKQGLSCEQPAGRPAGMPILAALAALAALAGGCSMPGSRATFEPEPGPAEAFLTIDRLAKQVQTVPDEAKRAELTATIERLRAQLTFGEIKMPPVARLLLARDIEILPTTRVADWTGDGQPDGFEVQIVALDYFGDSTKICGKLYFELFGYRPATTDRRSLQRVGFWEVTLDTAAEAVRYWDRYFLIYHFNLVWQTAPEVGQNYIFQVIYIAPWGEVITAQRTLIRTQ